MKPIKIFRTAGEASAETERLVNKIKAAFEDSSALNVEVTVRSAFKSPRRGIMTSGRGIEFGVFPHISIDRDYLLHQVKTENVSRRRK